MRLFFAGLQLYDIRYAGERIVYELGLQETFTYYSGNTPFDQNQLVIDGVYIYGALIFELLKGKNQSQSVHIN